MWNKFKIVPAFIHQLNTTYLCYYNLKYCIPTQSTSILSHYLYHQNIISFPGRSILFRSACPESSPVLDPQNVPHPAGFSQPFQHLFLYEFPDRFSCTVLTKINRPPWREALEAGQTQPPPPSRIKLSLFLRPPDYFIH